MTLISGTKTARVEEAAVLSVPEPKWTDTWHPVGHRTVIRALEIAVKKTGLDTVSRQYSMNTGGKTPGSKMFGVWMLDQRTNGNSWSIGFRQSIDRSMALGICAGVTVMVCDNMVMSGEFIEFRKHTSGLNADAVFKLAAVAVDQVIIKIMELDAWHQSLKQIAIDDGAYKSLVYDGMVNGIIQPRRFNEFQEAHAREMELSSSDIDQQGAMTLYTYHGAATRLMRSEALFRVSSRNAALEQLMNGRVNAWRQDDREEVIDND